MKNNKTVKTSRSRSIADFISKALYWSLPPR